ncbi:DUF4230 domain-containing protein [Anaerococcus sp. AGMB09787]|uniref:DUF4230 domain-containing protein n=1 Tax=Anaerococcus sp. AGMB09787 TaxID=2922869 RepID=UPI001FAF9468|nr:DUF4230 domain-containing protein [Anaerococcus sp. AGMB09787]
MKSKVKKGIIILVGLVVLVFGSYFLGMKAGVFNAKPEISSDIVLEQLQDVKELTTLKYTYTNVGSFENENEFYGVKIPFTLKKFIISYDGNLSAGIDLDEVEVNVDNKGKKINITMPEAKILSHQIDEDSLTIFDEKNSIFNQFKIEDFQQFRVAEMKKVENDMIEKGFLDQAEERSKQAVIDILNINPIIAEEYQVNIK